MAYKINDTQLNLQPTTGRWVNRGIAFVDGNGHPVYPSRREFIMTWELVPISDLSELQGYFDQVGVTGSVSVTLPQYGASSYVFRDYSGCVIAEPEIGEFFEEHVTQVSVLISRIRTI